MALSRFRGRDAALQALDFVISHAELTEAQGFLIAGKFPLTTLDRLLSTPAVRSALGFELVGGKLLTDLPAEEALKSRCGESCWIWRKRKRQSLI
jgi:hypothetical protein